jgi:hypothetical protein
MLSEQKITFEVAAWLDRNWVISDAVALGLFEQYRGSSDYPFAGVGPTGIVDDPDSLLKELALVVDSLPLTGNSARLRELAALKGWVHNWVDRHVDVDNEDDKIARVFGEGP